MKYQLDLDGILDFEHGQGLFPDEVVSEIGRQLEKATKGFVKGLVKKYDGPIESYKQMFCPHLSWKIISTEFYFWSTE